MFISKVAIGLTMKVMPEKFEPFDATAFVEYSLVEGDDPNKAKLQALDFTSHMLEEALRTQLDKFYGTNAKFRCLDMKLIKDQQKGNQG